MIFEQFIGQISSTKTNNKCDNFGCVKFVNTICLRGNDKIQKYIKNLSETYDSKKEIYMKAQLSNTGYYLAVSRLRNLEVFRMPSSS